MRNPMKISRAPTGQLTYRYNIGPGMGFAFHLLCEVGEPWQPDARAALDDLRRKGYRIETRELDAAPWIADFAVKP